MEIINLKILLVEDDKNTRSAIRAMLMEMGATTILEATDGRQAQEALDLQENNINFVICDWNMPHKTGFEFLREIRTTHTSLPFLMITARADQNSILDAKKAGVTGYIRKPFSMNELNTKMTSMLSHAS